MEKQYTEEDFKNIASQLRKPEGENGLKIAEVMNKGNSPMNLYSIAALNPLPNDNILEVGMGNGYFVKNIVSLSSTINYFGCDYSALMVEEARKLNKNWVDKGSVSFLKATIDSLPYKNHSFHKIITINTFYFWEDHHKALSEIKRVLKPRGNFILSVRPKHNLEKFPVTKYNFNILSNKKIIELLKANGFVRIEVTEIKEPIQEEFLSNPERETVIFNCTL